MTSLLLGSVKDFGRRIRVVGLVPAGIFVAVVLALVAAGAPGEAPNLGRLAARVGGLAAWQGVCLLLAVVVLVVLVQPAQLSLIRVLEGYGGRSAPAVRLADWRRARHATRRAALDSATRVPADQPVDHDVRRRLALADHELRVRYPPTADLMPTALGNALRAAESRAGRRYALEAVTMWPRLYAILPDRVARLIDDQREQLDLAANLCIAMILTAAVSTALLATHAVVAPAPGRRARPRLARLPGRMRDGDHLRRQPGGRLRPASLRPAPRAAPAAPRCPVRGTRRQPRAHRVPPPGATGCALLHPPRAAAPGGARAAARSPWWAAGRRERAGRVAGAGRGCSRAGRYGPAALRRRTATGVMRLTGDSQLTPMRDPGPRRTVGIVSFVPVPYSDAR